MKPLVQFFKEPLLHFLLIGILLFAGYQALQGDSDDPREIVVTRHDLLRYIQYRAKAFDSERFNEMMDTMPKEQLQGFIDDYSREEALYREAKALNLDQNDYVARLRLIQQLEFITRGFANEVTELDEQALESYYQAHQETYYQPAEVTFTHVFFNADRRGREAAHALAVETLETLNAKPVPFHEAVSYGDRFLYHLNYVNKQADEIASHFGETLQAEVFALTPDGSQWHGPYSSPYGEHLVLLSQHKPGYQPPLAEVRGRVHQDALQQAQEAKVEEAIQSIVETYKVRLAEGLQKPSSAGEQPAEDQAAL